MKRSRTEGVGVCMSKCMCRFVFVCACAGV